MNHESEVIIIIIIIIIIIHEFHRDASLETKLQGRRRYGKYFKQVLSTYLEVYKRTSSSYLWF